MNDLEHILQQEAVRHPDAEHRHNIIYLSGRQPCAFERIAVAFAQVRSNPVVEFHALLSPSVSDAS
jgi:hypothetical protein